MSQDTSSGREIVVVVRLEVPSRRDVTLRKSTSHRQSKRFTILSNQYHFVKFLVYEIGAISFYTYYLSYLKMTLVNTHLAPLPMNKSCCGNDEIGVDL